MLTDLSQPWPPIDPQWAPPPPRYTRLFITRPWNGPWEAAFPEFTIASMGETMDEAIIDTCSLLYEYLQWCHADGETFEQAIRPTKPGWRDYLRMAARGHIIKVPLSYVIGSSGNGPIHRNPSTT